MKILRFISLTFIAVFLSVGLLVACGDDRSTTKYDTIILSDNNQSNIVFKSEAGSQEIKFTCAADWYISNLDRDATWFTVRPTSGNAGESSITIEVKPNDNYNYRSSYFNICVTTGQGITNMTPISFTQAGKADIVYTQNTEVPGTLYELLKTYEIRKLKLSGYINGADFATIRQMPLTEIDLSDVHIVGGGSYTVYHKNISINGNHNIPCTTQDNIFPPLSFYNARLQSIILPKSIKAIDERAFESCTSLTSITIPESVTTIGGSIFLECINLISITIPESVTTISNRAFEGCKSLTSIKIPESVIKIGENAFLGCNSLTSINIPKSVKTIGGSTFSNCTSLTSITIPESVTTIDNSTFSKCTSLTAINIPESVTTIRYGAFEGCKNLVSVTISKRIETIGKMTFRDCSALKEIHIENSTPPIVNNDTFSTYSQVALYVPTGSKEAYQKNEIWKQFGTIIEE